MNTPHVESGPVDSLIEDVRQRRRDLLASCGDDLETLLRLIREREAGHPERIADVRATRDPKSHPKD